MRRGDGGDDGEAAVRGADYRCVERRRRTSDEPTRVVRERAARKATDSDAEHLARQRAQPPPLQPQHRPAVDGSDGGVYGRQLGHVRVEEAGLPVR